MQSVLYELRDSRNKKVIISIRLKVEPEWYMQQLGIIDKNNFFFYTNIE